MPHPEICGGSLAPMAQKRFNCHLADYRLYEIGSI